MNPTVRILAGEFAVAVRSARANAVGTDAVALWVVTFAVDVTRSGQAVKAAGAPRRAAAISIGAYTGTPIVALTVHMTRSAFAIEYTLAA